MFSVTKKFDTPTQKEKNSRLVIDTNKKPITIINIVKIAIQAKYMTFLVSACTVIALAIAPGVLSSEEPDWCEPSPLKQMQTQKNWFFLSYCSSGSILVWQIIWVIVILFIKAERNGIKLTEIIRFKSLSSFTGEICAQRPPIHF